MAEEINKDVNKKRRIPKLVVAVLLIVLLIGSLQVIHIVKFQVGKLSKQAQDDIEMKDFNEIIVSCRSEVVRDYGTHADGGISEERFGQLVEECVYERSENGSYDFRYSE